MAHDIFISYSTKDKVTADAICNDFETKGLRCWYAPRDIVPGADWAESIIQAIDDAKAMVLIFTRDANLSKQVLREVNYAVGAGVPIIPFRLTEEEPDEGMRYYLAASHWLDAVEADFEEARNELYDLCRAVVDSKPGETEYEGGLPPAAADAKASKSKKFLPVIIAAVVVAFALCGGLLWHFSGGGGSDSAGSGGGGGESGGGTITDVGEIDTYTTGNLQGTLQNGGYLAFDGDYYYFNHPEGLYRMSKDGSEVICLNEDLAEYISLYDGYVYFSTFSKIMRMTPDGKTKEKIADMNPSFMCIINDRIYVFDILEGLYSLKPDGSDIVHENTMDGPLGTVSLSYCLDGKYIYYVDGNDDHLYRLKIGDDSDLKCLVEEKTKDVTIADGKLYYLNADLCLTTYDLASGESTVVNEDVYLFDMVVTEYGIFGENSSGLLFYNFKQDKLVTLYEAVIADCVCVAGGKIYYSDDNYGLINVDGSDRTMMKDIHLTE